MFCEERVKRIENEKQKHVSSSVLRGTSKMYRKQISSSIMKITSKTYREPLKLMS